MNQEVYTSDEDLQQFKAPCIIITIALFLLERLPTA